MFMAVLGPLQSVQGAEFRRTVLALQAFWPVHTISAKIITEMRGADFIFAN